MDKTDNKIHLSNQNGVGLQEIITMLFVNRRVIIETVAIFVFLAILFIFFKKPVYMAESEIQINQSNQRIFNIESLFYGSSSMDIKVKSEIDIIKSRKIAKGVIKKLNLIDYSETDIENNYKIKKKYTEMVNAFISNEKIIANPNSYTVKIQYFSVDAKKSSRISNAIVDQYLEEQLNAKFESLKIVNKWLSTRVDDLREKLRSSELAVQKFKQENGIIKSEGRDIEERKTIDLNAQLISVSSERAQAEARLGNALSLIKSNNIDSSADVLNSSLIQKLRSQETDVLRKKSDLETKYGPKHPSIINVNAELNDLNKKINLEINKIIKSLENEVKIVKSKEENIKANILELQKKINTKGSLSIQLLELEREMEANKVLYESFLSRFKEISQERDYEQPIARIISRAEVPISPIYPQKKLILFVSFILGLMFGSGIVLIKKYFDFGIDSIQEIENISNIPVIGIVPEIKSSKGKIVDYCLKKPTSRFSESMRSIMVCIELLHKKKKSLSLLILSSTPQEGKTTFAISFARMQAKSGKKVLLIDGDMRFSCLTDLFENNIEKDLRDYLTGNATIKNITYKDKESGLDYIASTTSEVNSKGLLQSDKMENLLNESSKKYDLVIIDSSPINEVSDAFILADKVDTSLYLIRAKKTKRTMIKTILKRMKLNNINLSGIVLNRVDNKNNGIFHNFYKKDIKKKYNKYYKNIKSKYSKNK